MVEVKLSDLRTINKDQKYYWSKPDKIELIDSINTNGFDGEKSVITISNDYYIIDGHHRCEILKDMYGPDYKILVKKYFFSRTTYIITLSTILLLLSPIIIIVYILKKWI